MRAKEFITEGRGIGAREPGTIFYNEDGDTLELVSIHYFPPEPGSYPSTDVLDQELQEFIDDFEGEQVWFYGNQTAKSKAAMITVWKNSKGEMEGHAKYSEKVAKGLPGITWTNTDFKRATGFGPRDIKTTVQALDVKPGDVLGGKEIAISKIPDELEKNLEPRDVDDKIKSQMVEMVKNAGSGYTEPTVGAGENQNLHEVYTGEYAAPYILAMNSPLINGDMKAIEDALLKPQGLTWRSFKKAVWPTSTSEKLVDSYLIAGNYRLGVSSKAKTGGGASASVDGIMNIVTTKKDQFDTKFKRKHAEFIKALENIMRLSTNDGPLQVGIDFGFISNKAANEIKDRMASYDNNADTLSKELKSLLSKSAPTRQGGTYTPGNMDHPGYCLGFHLFAILTRLIANKMNSMNPTDFFKGVLNYADLVQVYAKVGKKGEDGMFTEFSVVYPPTFDGKILIDGESNFYATGKPKGRITFKLKKN